MTLTQYLWSVLAWLVLDLLLYLGGLINAKDKTSIVLQVMIICSTIAMMCWTYRMIP